MKEKEESFCYCLYLIKFCGLSLFPFSDKRLMECFLMQKLTAANGWLRAASLMLLKGDSNITPCGSSPVV